MSDINLHSYVIPVSKLLPTYTKLLVIEMIIYSEIDVLYVEKER